MICRNREPNTNGVSYGGVALIWKEDLVSFKRIRIAGVDRYEIMACIGTISGHRRRLAAIASYIPPNVLKREAEECMQYIADAVVNLKRDYSSPFVMVAGDFNQWRNEDYLDEFADMAEAPVGCTRGRRSIDRFFQTSAARSRSPGSGRR